MSQIFCRDRLLLICLVYSIVKYLTAICRSKTESLVSDVKIFKTTFVAVSRRRDFISKFRANCGKMSIKRICQVGSNLFIETPFTISSLIEGVLLLRDVSSVIVCQVRRESFWTAYALSRGVTTVEQSVPACLDFSISCLTAFYTRPLFWG